MNIIDLKSNVPAVFATQPSPKMSDKYAFVPTFELLENFINQGWTLAKASQRGRGIYSLHELRFRNDKLPKVGDCIAEAIIRNSHNGTTTLSVMVGLNRLVCNNGLTVPTSVSESFTVRHQRFNYEDVITLSDSFASKLPLIEKSVNRMMNRELTITDKISFIKRAINVRWKTGSVPSSLDVMSIMYPKREEDNKNDLWTLFNVIQENFVAGGLKYTDSNNRTVTLKGLKSLITVSELNVKLWELAEEYC